MITPLRTFTTHNGRTFAVRILPAGARYGCARQSRAHVHARRPPLDRVRASRHHPLLPDGCAAAADYLKGPTMDDSQHIRQIVDNDEHTYDAVTDAVYDHLRDHLGYTGMTAEEYRQESARGPIAYEIRWTVRDVIYDAAVRSAAAQGVDMDSLTGQLLGVTLDHSNASLWEDVAECYVPSVEDYAEHFGEEI